jgi:hypothetical protein
VSARAHAARVWLQRYHAELEAAERFRVLAAELAALGVSQPVAAMAARAASDELEHAALCRDLVEHFGGAVPATCAVELRRVAPSHYQSRERTLYEIVAMSCVTETLSTTLLGELLERASDALLESTMRSILRDEVVHSQLGWALLAEEMQRGTADCVGRHLPAMLEAAVGPDLRRGAADTMPFAEELAGLGRLDLESSRRVVRETLELVIFPGLSRFGVDVSAGLAWLASKT